MPKSDHSWAKIGEDFFAEPRLGQFLFQIMAQYINASIGQALVILSRATVTCQYLTTTGPGLVNNFLALQIWPRSDWPLMAQYIQASKYYLSSSASFANYPKS